MVFLGVPHFGGASAGSSVVGGRLIFFSVDLLCGSCGGDHCFYLSYCVLPRFVCVFRVALCFGELPWLASTDC